MKNIISNEALKRWHGLVWEAAHAPSLLSVETGAGNPPAPCSLGPACSGSPRLGQAGGRSCSGEKDEEDSGGPGEAKGYAPPEGSSLGPSVLLPWASPAPLSQ